MFDRNQCACCPCKEECKAKIYKKVSKVKVSIMGHENAIQQRLMETKEYNLLTRIRNGIETVMSVLRRAYLSADRSAMWTRWLRGGCCAGTSFLALR